MDKEFEDMCIKKFLSFCLKFLDAQSVLSRHTLT